ncbi:MAG: mechanosensitive ion channel family protein [Phormidium sp.]
MKPIYLQKFKLKYVTIGLMTCMWLLLSPMTISANTQVNTTDGIKNVENPLGWKSYGMVGDVVYAPIRLDGHHLFTIAAERTKQTTQWGFGAIQIRRDRIENRLNSQVRYLVENRVDPKLLQVFTTQLNKQMAVQTALNGNVNKPIATITALDAEIYGLTEAEVAEEYAQQIRQGLLRAVAERQPDVWRSHLQSAVSGGAIATLLIVCLFWGQRRIDNIRRELRQEFHSQQKLLTQEPEITEIEEDTTQNVSAEQQQLFDLKRQIDQKTWQKRILQLCLVLVGVVGLSWMLRCFPETRTMGILLFRQPMGLLLIGLGFTMAIILSHFLIDWLLTKWVGTEDQLPLALIERRRRRFLALSPLWKSVLTFLLIGLGLVLAYSLFSISTGLTLFTEIGVMGLAVSLAFQSSIKDALTGWMLLAEDAFTVGDIVAIKDVSGVVESMGLLVTKIRSSPGDLITLRNGEITYVTNRSKDWSRIDFTVLVEYDTEVKKAMTIMRQVFQTIQSDPVWGLQLIGEPDILGIEKFDDHGILLKIRAQTQPGQQFNVTREFRLRLNQAFQDAGIIISIPQRAIRYRSP